MGFLDREKQQKCIKEEQKKNVIFQMNVKYPLNVAGKAKSENRGN